MANRRWLIGLAVALPSLIPMGFVVKEALSPAGRHVLWSMLAHPQVLLNSMGLALAVAGVGVPLAMLLAWVSVYVDHPLVWLVRATVFILFVMPPFVVSGALLVLVGHNGLLARFLPVWFNIYGPVGIFLASLLAFLPFAYWLLVDGFRAAVRPEIEMARVFGASKTKIFTTITWPAMRSSAIIAFLFLFVETLTDVTNPLVLGGDFPVLASRLYLAVSAEFDPAAGAAYALVLALPAVIIWAASSNRLTRPVSLPLNYRLRTGRIGWLGRIAIGASAVVAATTLALVGAVLATSVLTHDGGRLVWTSHWFLEAMASPRIWATTLVVAGASTLISTPLGVWLAVWQRKHPGWNLSSALNLGQSLPGLALGLGMLLLVLQFRTYTPDWSLVAIIVLLVIRMTPTVTVTNLTGLQRLTDSLLEVSAVLGATRQQRWLTIWVPYLRRPAVAAAATCFTRSITVLNSVILLSTASVPLVPVQVLKDLDAGRLGVASATAVLLAATMVVFAGTAGLAATAFERGGRT